MASSSSSIVLTGADGFLGSAIVAAARAQGLALSAVGGPRSANGIALSDIAALTNVFRGADVLVHAAGLAHVFGRAARDANRFDEVNVRGTENAVRASIDAGLRHIVLVSSVAVYGPHADAVVTEDHPCAPEGAYATSKLRAEEVAREIAGSAIGLTILRMATIYGEGDRGNIARLAGAIRRHRFIRIGRGRNRKTLIHRDDGARACLVAATARLRGVYNVTGGVHTMATIVGEIGRAAGVRILTLPVPDAMLDAASLASATLRKFLADDAYDGSRFANETGFAPAVTLEEGIRRQLAAAGRS